MLAEKHRTIPFLTTKLHLPPLLPTAISRSRLVGRLNAGLWQNGFLNQGAAAGPVFARRLTLVSAPAGFGKTTLVSEWAQDLVRNSARVSVSWLSLDSGDNDPSRFLVYLVAALQKLDEHIGGAVLRALSSPEAAVLAQGTQIQVLLTDLINQVNGLSDSLANEGNCLVLVLDDYHVLTSRSIHAAVEFLLDHLPDNLHIVIATRSDPPFQMARLRGRGQVLELRQADLRFDAAEATAFLHQMIGVGLVDKDINALASRTEGWIAGLQMAAVSIQGQDANDASEFVRAFTGSNHFILDYLVEEVLGQRPAGTREFLLKTSILDTMCKPLCDAILGSADGGGAQLDSQLILEQLEHANLFIVPLDHDRRWYRYHRLFADLLKKRLGQEYVDLVPTLHHRASEWCERNGHFSAAIEHALSAGDFERAAQLIESAAQPAFLAGEYVTLLTQIQSLPCDIVEGRPRLCAFMGLACLLAGRQMDEFAPLMNVLAIDAAADIPAELLVLRALLLTFRGDLAQSIELSHRALERLPAEDVVLRGFTVRNLGATYRLNGDVDATIKAFEMALRLGRKARDPIGASVALNYLADMHVVRGQLFAAQTLYEEALETAVNGKGRRLPVAIKVLVGLAELHRQWNDFAQATRYVEEAIELGRSWVETWAMGAFIPLARMKQALGDAAAAREAVQEAERLAVAYDATDIDDIAVAAFKARLRVAQADITAGQRWADERGLSVDTAEVELVAQAAGTVPYYLREVEYLSLARLYIADGRADDAMAVLQTLENTTERLRRTGILIEILVLQALAFSSRGDHYLAVGALERAVLLAKPERYVRVFVDEGTELFSLLRRVAARGVAPRYVGELLAAFGGTASRATASRATDTASLSEAAQALVEPLSERELDVLRLLNTHLTSTLMADELFIAVSTVRSHIKSIYGKLNVHSREEAVQHAQELGLL